VSKFVEESRNKQALLNKEALLKVVNEQQRLSFFEN
jgi:hypothetical protein